MEGGSGWLGQCNGVWSFQTVMVFCDGDGGSNGVLGKFCDCVVTCVETTLVATGFIKISDIWFDHGDMVIWFHQIIFLCYNKTN